MRLGRRFILAWPCLLHCWFELTLLDSVHRCRVVRHSPWDVALVSVSRTRNLLQVQQDLETSRLRYCDGWPTPCACCCWCPLGAVVQIDTLGQYGLQTLPSQY